MLSQLLNHLNAREKERLATKAQETENTLESHLAASTADTEAQQAEKHQKLGQQSEQSSSINLKLIFARYPFGGFHSTAAFKR